MQEARRLLASAVTDRSDLPVRFAEDPAELRSLAQSAATLDAFAEGLAGLEQDVGPPMADFEGAQGSLPLPVTGARVLRRYREPDAAGVARPGLVLDGTVAMLDSRIDLDLLCGTLPLALVSTVAPDLPRDC